MHAACVQNSQQDVHAEAFDLRAAIWCRGPRAGAKCTPASPYQSSAFEWHRGLCTFAAELCFFFFLSARVTPGTSDLMALPLSLSFQSPLPVRPQASALVTLVRYARGKYVFSCLQQEETSVLTEPWQREEF